MGDRGNIAVLQSDDNQVWLYSHWGGYGLPADLQDGLRAGKGRWQDESYLAKIIFGHAVPCDERSWHGETGYGISGTIQDNEHPILVVDIPKQRVFTMPEEQLENGKVPIGYNPATTKKTGPWTFEEYIALSTLPWGERRTETEAA